MTFRLGRAVLALQQLSSQPSVQIQAPSLNSGQTQQLLQLFHANLCTPEDSSLRGQSPFVVNLVRRKIGNQVGIHDDQAPEIRKPS